MASVVPRRDACGLGAGERQRAIPGAVAARAAGALHRALVEAGRIARELDAGGGKKAFARRAFGGEHEPHVSRPWRRAMSFRIAAAVSSIERRVTSITGQRRSVNTRRASSTSSRTASRSV